MKAIGDLRFLRGPARGVTGRATTKQVGPADGAHGPVITEGRGETRL